MPETVYLETTIISYLTARPTRDVIRRAHQKMTVDWWARIRPMHNCYVSELVVLESTKRDAGAAKRRSAVLDGIPVLAATDDATVLAEELLRAKIVPASSRSDALHIAIAAVHGMDFLRTWNCRHIANAAVMRDVDQTCMEHGLRAPMICTPEQLMELS